MDWAIYSTSHPLADVRLCSGRRRSRLGRRWGRQSTLRWARQRWRLWMQRYTECRWVVHIVSLVCNEHNIPDLIVSGMRGLVCTSCSDATLNYAILTVAMQPSTVCVLSKMYCHVGLLLQLIWNAHEQAPTSIIDVLDTLPSFYFVSLAWTHAHCCDYHMVMWRGHLHALSMCLHTLLKF